MTFLADYEMGSVGYTLLITVVALQWSIFTEAFFSQMYTNALELFSSSIELDIWVLINSLYAVAAVLISFGGVIGKTSPLQLLVLTLLELIFYSFNNRILLVGALGIQDCGGTITIHMFGAYYGIAVAWMIGLPTSEVLEAYTSDIFSFIGTVLHTYAHTTHTHTHHIHSHNTHTSTRTHTVHSHTHTHTHTHLYRCFFLKRSSYGFTGRLS